MTNPNLTFHKKQTKSNQTTFNRNRLYYKNRLKYTNPPKTKQ